MALCRHSLSLVSFQNQGLFENLKWMHGCFLSVHSHFLSSSQLFPDSFVCLWYLTFSYYRSSTESVAKVGSSTTLLQTLFGGLLMAFISHRSEFPVYCLTAEPFNSYLFWSPGAWLNRESDSCTWRAPFTTHLSVNE